MARAEGDPAGKTVVATKVIQVLTPTGKPTLKERIQFIDAETMGERSQKMDRRLTIVLPSRTTSS